MEKKSLLDRAVEFIFSNDNRKYLIPILLIALILRIIVAMHISPISDEMVHGTNAINIISSGVINEQNECPAWFYLTDISYKLFGVNAFAGRFLSIFFGTLAVLLIYLIAKKLFNEKIALLSSFLLAISAYVITYTLMEMDEAMIFFVLLSFYFFLKGMDNKQISYTSVILMGVAVLVKPIALTFVPALAIYFLIMLYKEAGEARKIMLKKNTPRIILAIIILLLFATPILAYNYILYRQKGIVDVLFSRFFHINQQIYSSLQGYNKSFSLWEAVSFGLPWMIKSAFFLFDPAITILALFGLFTIFLKKEYKKARFFALFFLITLIFLLGSAQLQTHFTSFLPLLCFSAALFVDFLSEKFEKFGSRRIIIIILILVLIINLYIIWAPLTGESGVFRMRSFAVSSVTSKDIVVTDARIYRGQVAWAFNDKAYLEASYLQTILDMNQNYSGQVPTTVYFVECAIDDCGWGTIKNQPDLNQSMENLFSQIKSISSDEQVLYGGSGLGEKNGEQHFIVYKTSMNLSPAIFPVIYGTHEWFYYPVRWLLPDWYDKYSPEGLFQVSFNTLGKIFLWLSVILAILSPILLIKELMKNG